MTLFSDVANDVLNRLNLQNSEEPNSTELLVYLGQSQLALYDLVIDHDMYKVKYFQTVATPNVNGIGQIGFALPSDFYRERALEKSMSVAGQWINCSKAPYSQRNNSVFQTSMIGTYNLRYYPTMPMPASSQVAIDPMFDSTGWWEWMSLDTCIKVRIKLELDPSAYATQIQAVRNRIVQASNRRDQDQGKRLDPFRGRQRSGWYGPSGCGMPTAAGPAPFVGPFVSYIIEGTTVLLVPGGDI